MSSYFIKYNKDRFGDDRLEVAFSKEEHCHGDMIVKDAYLGIKKLIDNQTIKGGKILKINGKQSLLVSYVLAHELCHLYSIIAVSDLRLSSLITVISNDNNYPIGSLIDLKTNRITFPTVQTKSITPSYLIDWQKDILSTRINRFANVDGNQLVIDAEKRLNYMLENEQIKGGKQPLLINGRSSILTGFVIANKLAHLYDTIAVFDPKIGDRGTDRYIVVINHSPNHKIGDYIDRKSENKESIKIAICGSPNTGKTVLALGLHKALLRNKNAPEPYYISACPDGEGSWFNDSHDNFSSEEIKRLKDEYKAQFTLEFAENKAVQLENDNHPILIFDVGGRIRENGEFTPENQIIISKATYAIILYTNEIQLQQWQEGCEDKLGVRLIAKIFSKFDKDKTEIDPNEDIIITVENVFQGIIHQLKRGKKSRIEDRFLLDELAQFIANIAK